MEKYWGSPWGVRHFAPSMEGDIAFRRWWATFLRLAASPGAAADTVRMAMEIDVRHVLPMIRSPTLVMHAIHDRIFHIEHARYLAEHIHGARLVEIPERDHFFSLGSARTVLGEIEEFLTGLRRQFQQAAKVCNLRERFTYPSELSPF